MDFFGVPDYKLSPGQGLQATGPWSECLVGDAWLVANHCMQVARTLPGEVCLALRDQWCPASAAAGVQAAGPTRLLPPFTC